MNKTKKLTTGAMMLAICGALILIDRQFSYFLKEIIVLLTPVVIIMYTSMYDMKDGVIFSISLLILGFLLGSDIYYYCYLPISIVVGLSYSFGIKKGFSKNKLLLISILFFILGEALITFALYPILGLDISSQLQELRTVYEQTFASAGIGEETFASYGINLSSLLLIGFVLSTIIMGVMEGIIIHILSIFLLNRFKIKTIAKGPIMAIDLNSTLSYILIIGASLLFLINRVDNENLKLVFITISFICTLVLAYFGYIFILLFNQARGRRKSSFLLIIAIILFMPFSIFALMIIGFLYGAGPFKKVLIDINTNTHGNN